MKSPLRLLARPAGAAVVALGLTACALSAAAVASQTIDPPGPTLPRQPHLYAVALEDGTLYRQADVASDAILEFRRGYIFEYLGEIVDTFGRDWYSVGSGDGWRRTESWYAIPATREEVRDVTGRVSVLQSLPAPLAAPAVEFATSEAAAAYNASLKKVIAVGRDWWDQSLEIDVASLGRLGLVVGVGAFLVPPDVAEELVTMLGGAETLGPWPQDPAFGRLYVAPRTRFVYRFDGADWRLMDPPLAMDSFIGLLGNPRLSFDPEAPPEATGPRVSCWRLVGGLSPRGGLAGSVAAAPAPPSSLEAAARPDADRRLGYYNLTGRAWPTAAPSTYAPRRVLPEKLAGGVLLSDTSQRQAVYLEQVIPLVVTRQLRGREVRARVMARAAGGEGAMTATVALEVEAGSVRQSVSAQVGALPTPVELNLVIPEDAETIIVRILPTDVSIAVLEGGSVVIDSATVAPAEWPSTLEAAPLLLRRVRSITYRPAPRYTRAALVVTERTPEELQVIWRQAEGQPFEQLEKILSGEVEVEMTARQVQLAWGEPTSVTAGDLTRWVWPDRTASFDDTGLLLAWSRQPEQERARSSICGRERGESANNRRE